MIVISQLTDNFKDMTYAAEKFTVLPLNALCSIDDNELQQATMVLKNEYPYILTDEFPIQFLLFRATMEQQICKKIILTGIKIIYKLLVE